MMISCKHCQIKNIVKSGLVSGKQRYLCQNCKRTTRLGDKRVKYAPEKKKRAIALYLEGMGIRAIGRLEEVSTALLVYWFRDLGKKIDKKLNSGEVSDDEKEIEVLEVDELFSHVQKKTKSLYLVSSRPST